MVRNNVTVYVCDACGREELAKVANARNETYETMPDGWTAGKGVSKAHFCPDCSKRLACGSEQARWRAGM